MKQFIRNSLLILFPYLLVAVVCSLVFGYFFIFLLLVLFAFILTQLAQLYYFQKWCRDQSTIAPSVGLNRIWKNIYLLLETQTNNQPKNFEFPIDELQNIYQKDYGIILLKDHKIKWFNKAAGELLKLDMDRDSGTDISYTLRTPKFLDLLNEKRYAQEVTLDDKHPPIAICLLPYDTKHLCMLVRDISRYLKAIDTNRELIANLAHELRSPLTVIRGYIDILKDMDAKTKNKDLKEMVNNMQVQVMRLKMLSDNTLNLACLENTELSVKDQSRIDVAAMLESILKNLNIDAEKPRIDVRIEDFFLRGSDSELHSTFYNLIDNARCHSQSEEIKIVWRRDDQGAYFEVIDNGIGIEASHLPKLTKRFYRVEQARSGTQANIGLGLSIVKQVLDRHHATLEIESEIGKGSTFRCCFPLACIED